MPEQITASEFDKFTKQSFEYLEKEYGFTMRKLDDWAYVAETSNTIIHIYVEHYAILVVEIEPIGEPAKWLLSQNMLPSRAGIVPLSNYYNPNLNYEPALLDPINFVQNIPVELDKRAELLKTYFIKMLQGDFSDWPQMGKYRP